MQIGSNTFSGFQFLARFTNPNTSTQPNLGELALTFNVVAHLRRYRLRSITARATQSKRLRGHSGAFGFGGLDRKRKMSGHPRHRHVKLVLVCRDFTLNNTKTWMSANDFDQTMAALGLMTSRFNFLETEFKLALIKLLNCRNQDAAYAVVEERRGFKNLLTLVQKLFAIYNSDTESLARLAEIISTAQALNDRRNTYVHSMWYQPIDLQKPVARMKGRHSEELSPIVVIGIAEEMAQCLTELRDLMTYSLPIDGREQ